MSSNDQPPIDKTTPLVRQRDTRAVLNSLLDTISDELKRFLSGAEEGASKIGFFGTANNQSEKNKIIEQTLTAVKELKKKVGDFKWDEGVHQLGDILLRAKFQSLAFYIQKGQKPLLVDRTIDNCISFLINQATKLNSEGQANQLFKSLLVFHYTVATKQLYDAYFEQISTLVHKNNGDELTLAAIARYKEQLNVCNTAFMDGINAFAPQIFDPLHKVMLSAELLPEMTDFLNKQTTTILNLEPAETDLSIADISNMYTWGVTAVSKLSAYVRSVNEQLLEALTPPNNKFDIS